MLAIEVRADPADFRIMRAAGHAHIYLNGALQYKGRPKTGYMGIAFFLWMKRGIDDSYNG